MTTASSTPSTTDPEEILNPLVTNLRPGYCFNSGEIVVVSKHVFDTPRLEALIREIPTASNSPIEFIHRERPADLPVEHIEPAVGKWEKRVVFFVVCEHFEALFERWHADSARRAAHEVHDRLLMHHVEQSLALIQVTALGDQDVEPWKQVLFASVGPTTLHRHGFKFQLLSHEPSR